MNNNKIHYGHGGQNGIQRSLHFQDYFHLQMLIVVHLEFEFVKLRDLLTSKRQYDLLERMHKFNL